MFVITLMKNIMKDSNDSKPSLRAATRNVLALSHLSNTPRPHPQVLAQLLPQFPKNNTVGTDDTDLSIVMDWPLDDRLLTSYNYLALDSFLSIYSSASFRLFVPASEEVLYRKVGNLLSVSTFEKYKRRGYDIKVLPVGSVESPLGQKVGHEYWSSWVDRYFKKYSESFNLSSRIPPYHLLNYVRLRTLWKRGGIFTDLSMMLLGSLSPPAFTQVPE